MKALIWATTFGADLWALARALDERDDIELRVATPDPELFAGEPIASLFPLESEIVRRSKRSSLLGFRDFDADVTIMDNRVPVRAPSPAGFMLWHGFGWRGPNDEKEFAFLHASLRKNWGPTKEPNPRFVWQCFGPWDFEHRTQISGFAEENCRVLGSASHDFLREPIDRERAASAYPFDVAAQPTVLIAPTWHYGEVFAHWGRDAELFRRLIRRCKDRGANVILRLHDSFRFESEYISFLESLPREFDNVLLKFKDRNPDNLIDLQVADVLITNYSSIANLFYATRRPTLHVYPVRSEDESFQWRTLGLTGVRTKEVESVRFMWKLPPEDNGGLLARDFDTLLEQLDRALEEPDCCVDRAQDFLDRHMLGADGKSCDRIIDALFAQQAEVER